MDQLSLDVVVTRGAIVESHHRVHAAVVDTAGTLLAASRDADMVAYWRSCAKPFQVMPLLESGGFDRAGWGDDELALACASHGGEPEHVAIVERMLASIAMEEGDLACGPQEPLAQRGLKILREAGARPTRLHNNCSGKHAAMLARAYTSSWPTFGYERLDHPVQQGCLTEVARWTKLEPSRIIQGVDGCGCVVFGLPLQPMAHAFARLADAANRGDEIPSRVTHAMQTRPFLVSGSERFDSALIEATEGRVIAKIGAEGMHSVALMDEGIGVAVKVEDGAMRAQFPAVLQVLQHLGALPMDLPPRLAEFMQRPVRNTRGEIVGEVRPARFPSRV
jgi:L-asparaginase II